jgi:hypothetical protein
VKLEIQKQTILYQSPRMLDITKAVTKQLNEKYAAEQANPAAAGKPDAAAKPDATAK